MITLKDLLSEELHFKNGFDSDRPTGTKSVFVFHPNDTYIKQGKTHGLMSHAIKHLKEFEPELVVKIIDIVNDVIRKSPNKRLLNINNQPAKVKQEYPYPRGTIMNTLDMINDKVVLGTELRKEESVIVPYLEFLSQKYESILEAIVSDSVDVNSSKTVEDVKSAIAQSGKIKFGVESRDEKINIAVDLKTATVVLLSLDGQVLSGYRPMCHKKNWSSKQRLSNYFSKTSVTVTNPLIRKLFDLE